MLDLFFLILSYLLLLLRLALFLSFKQNESQVLKEKTKQNKRVQSWHYVTEIQ